MSAVGPKQVKIVEDQQEQTEASRRAALADVLNSETFARTDQLRRFIEYVCEKVIAGQSSEIKEYIIGVEVFRRPADYSPATDSCVRSRAWELRQKLEEFYTQEAPGAPVRIVLPKGSYVPQFVTAADAVPVQSGEATATVDPAAAPTAPGSWKALSVGCLLGFLLCGGLVGVWQYARVPQDRVPAALREAWGPLAGRNANVLIGLTGGMYMVVRPYPFNESPSRPALPVPPSVYEMLRTYRQAPSTSELYFRPTDNLVTNSVVSAVVAAAGTLRLLDSSFQILPERAAPLPALRGRNVMLFGGPDNSNAVDHELKRAYWTIQYDAGEKRMVIRDRRQPASARPLFLRGDRNETGPASVYGLITVLPSEGSSGDKRTIVVSGISSVGLHGAMEYFSSPENLAKLLERFVAQGLKGFPPAYQLAIRCTADDTLLLSTEYADHVVIETNSRP